MTIDHSVNGPFDLQGTELEDLDQWKSDGSSPEVVAYLTAGAAALALLNRGGRLTRKAGSFLGQLVVDPTPMSEAQRDWLATLLERAGLPPLAEGGGS